jgi:hypothetical protein
MAASQNFTGLSSRESASLLPSYDSLGLHWRKLSSEGTANETVVKKAVRASTPIGKWDRQCKRSIDVS